MKNKYLKKFDEMFDKKMLNTKGESPDVHCYNSGHNMRVKENWEEHKQIKQFISQALDDYAEEMMERVIPKKRTKNTHSCSQEKRIAR